MHPVIFRDSGAGADFITTSTVTSDTVEQVNGVDHYVVLLDISSASHPHYTGQANIVDTAGRVEKFQNRAAKKSTTGRKAKGRADEEAAQ